ANCFPSSTLRAQATNRSLTGTSASMLLPTTRTRLSRLSVSSTRAARPWGVLRATGSAGQCASSSLSEPMPRMISRRRCIRAGRVRVPDERDLSSALAGGGGEGGGGGGGACRTTDGGGLGGGGGGSASGGGGGRTTTGSGRAVSPGVSRAASPSPSATSRRKTMPVPTTTSTRRTTGFTVTARGTGGSISSGISYEGVDLEEGAEAVGGSPGLPLLSD